MLGTCWKNSNNETLDLTDRELEVVRAILADWVPGCAVRAFGSRVSGGARPHSDLDLAIVGPGPLALGSMALLRESFEESDLPFRVDLVDWESIGEDFRSLIARKYHLLQSPEADRGARKPAG